MAWWFWSNSFFLTCRQRPRSLSLSVYHHHLDPFEQFWSQSFSLIFPNFLQPLKPSRYSSPTKFKPWHSTQLQDTTAGCLRMPSWSSKVGYAWPAQPPTINTPEVAASSAAPDPSAPCMTLLPGEYWVCGKSMNYPISIYIYINISLLSLIYHYYSY